MPLITHQDLKSAVAKRRAEYAKSAGPFKLSHDQVLFNQFEHPGHRSYSMADHMRAAEFHNNQAKFMESSGKYIEAAHHREQSYKHKQTYQKPQPVQKSQKTPPSFPDSFWEYGRVLTDQEMQMAEQYVDHVDLLPSPTDEHLQTLEALENRIRDSLKTHQRRRIRVVK